MSDAFAQATSRVGETRVFAAPDEIGRAAIRYFAIAIGDANPLWLDAEHAKRHGFDDVVAPPTMICETNQLVPGPRGADGLLSQIFDLELPGYRQVRGGNAYAFARPVLASDRIKVTWRLESVTPKTAANGATMLIQRASATYEDAAGDVVARNVETTIAVPVDAERGTPPPLDDDGSEPLALLERTLTRTDLVAYAGATWDWHPLHHDPAYLASRGLTEPVVDGQMLGALMATCVLGAHSPSARVAALSIRYRSLMVAGERVRIEARPHDEAGVALRASVGNRLVADGTCEVADA